MPSANPRVTPSSDPHPLRPLHGPSFRHALYESNHNLLFNPPSTMYGNIAQQSHWQDHPLMHYPPNQYPPPPPPIPHKVWILDCKSCGMFLTNRGMKAVLLLRPNVSLYSSDALPVNCSAYASNPDVLRPRASCRPSTSFHAPPRTCECLTQTLCCHGCGATVGYMIVIPCVRCTSSITATNRATNGHRFVFHSSEIVGTERHYIPDEPGVVPYEQAITPLSPYAPSFIPPPIYASHVDAQSPHDGHGPSRSRSSSPSSLSEYAPTPPLEFADPILASANRQTFDRPPSFRGYSYILPEPYQPSSHSPSPYTPYIHAYPHTRPPPAPFQYIYPRLSRPSSADSGRSTNSSPPLLVHHHQTLPIGLPSEQKDHAPPQKLSPGDVLYWHHLARSGEIPGVGDDERARGKLRQPSPADEKISMTKSFYR